MSEGQEPFTGATLRRFFEQYYGARLLRQSGSHVTMQLPDGRQLRCPDDRSIVDKSLMRSNARVLDVTYLWLRTQLVPIQNRGRSRFRTETHPKRTWSKRDALSSLDELIGEATQIKSTVCNGDRDPVVYRRICDAVRSARRSLSTYERVKR